MTTITRPANYAQTLADFLPRWDAATAKVEADWASLTAAQRRAHRSRSPRINEIKAAYFSLRHPTGPQISIARLGYSPDVARGYGDDKVLANLARGGNIRIGSDRMRRPGVVRLVRRWMTSD